MSITSCYYCGGPGVFILKSVGKWCCSKSSNSCPAVKEKRRATSLERYGSSSPFTMEGFQEKRQKTTLERTGYTHHSQTPEFQSKMKHLFQERFGVSCALQAPSAKEKTKATILEKYGCEFISQSETIKQQKIQTSFEKFGVSHPMQSKEVREKVLATCLTRYGCENPSQNREVKEKRLETFQTRFGGNPMANKDIRVKHAYSMIEKYGVANALYLPENRSQRSVSKEGNSWLDQLGIPSHFREKIVTGTNFQVDALDEENKIVYEYLGSFWHGNPEKFNSQDIHPITKRTFGSMYQETQERLAIIESLGYQIVSKWS